MVSLITFNIFSSRLIKDDPSKESEFSELINFYSPDLLLLQEDLVNQSYYPQNYVKVAGCLTNENLMNSILVRSDLQNEVIALPGYRLATNKVLDVNRGVSTIIFKGIKIGNLHLSGGRVDDTFYKEIVTLRDQQVTPLASKSNLYDLVAGDFNGSPLENKFAYTHPIFIIANDEGKKIFKQYFQSGHKPFMDAGFSGIHCKSATDAFGGTPDHIYYKSDKLQLLDLQVIDMIGRQISDHNAIYANFKALE